MVFTTEQELALSVIMMAVEDLYMGELPVGDKRTPDEVERDRASAAQFFYGNEDESLYSLYAGILGVPKLTPDEIAVNLRSSGRKMAGRIRKASMVNIIGDW